jgi:hypothetical protein
MRGFACNALELKRELTPSTAALAGYLKNFPSLPNSLPAGNLRTKLDPTSAGYFRPPPTPTPASP